MPPTVQLQIVRLGDRPQRIDFRLGVQPVLQAVLSIPSIPDSSVSEGSSGGAATGSATAGRRDRRHQIIGGWIGKRDRSGGLRRGQRRRRRPRRIMHRLPPRRARPKPFRKLGFRPTAQAPYSDALRSSARVISPRPMRSCSTFHPLRRPPAVVAEQLHDRRAQGTSGPRSRRCSSAVIRPIGEVLHHHQIGEARTRRRPRRERSAAALMRRPVLRGAVCEWPLRWSCRARGPRPCGTPGRPRSPSTGRRSPR